MTAFGAASALILSLLLPSLESHEDLRTKAYLDPVGIPTVCVGETDGVKLGDEFSVSECRAMLAARVATFDAELGRCIRGEFPVEVRAAFLSWAYNVGSTAACNSTAVKKLNRHDLKGACDELLKWKYATDRKGRRVILPGILKRRVAEHAMCMKGV